MIFHLTLSEVIMDIKISVEEGLLAPFKKEILNYIRFRLEEMTQETIEKMGTPERWKSFLGNKQFEIIFAKILNKQLLSQEKPYNIPAHAIILKGGNEMVEFTGWGNPTFMSFLEQDDYQNFVNIRVNEYEQYANA